MGSEMNSQGLESNIIMTGDNDHQCSDVTSVRSPWSREAQLWAVRIQLLWHSYSDKPCL